MDFDPNNRVIQLCVQGMQKEAEMEPSEAKMLFIRAWEEAENNLEKLIAAHYVARHQEFLEDKLKWDELALSLALQHDDQEIKEFLPSLYLNIGKCHEDLGNLELARENYNKAEYFIDSLPDNGYGKMTKAGIEVRQARIAESETKSVNRNYRSGPELGDQK
jgi:tetratricopeptide (TPR) repeat protein